MPNIDVRITAVNPNDKFVRIMGLWVDKIPPKDWTTTLELQRSAEISAWFQSGETVSGSVFLDDGKHTLYLAISQGNNSILGSWSGNLTIDGITRPWQNVDFDTIAVFELVVKNGRVVDSKTEGNKENTGDETENMTYKETLTSVKNKLIEHKVATASVGIVVAVSTIGALLWKKNKRF